jgi:hypothetical protein
MPVKVGTTSGLQQISVYHDYSWGYFESLRRAERSVLIINKLGQNSFYRVNGVLLPSNVLSLRIGPLADGNHGLIAC